MDDYKYEADQPMSGEPKAPHPYLKRMGRVIREAVLEWNNGEEGKWPGISTT